MYASKQAGRDRVTASARPPDGSTTRRGIHQSPRSARGPTSGQPDGRGKRDRRYPPAMTATALPMRRGTRAAEVPRPRSSAGRAGRLCFRSRTMTDAIDRDDGRALAKAYVPAEFEHAIYERWLAADVFAPDGAGSTADPRLPPFVIIQPPPNVTGQPPPGPRAADDGRGPDDPPRPDARPPRRCSCPASTTPSIAAQFVLDGILAKEGESRASLGPRALPRADARVHRRDPRGDPRASSGASAARATGAACGSRWTRARAKAVRVAFDRLLRATASRTAPRR